MVLLGVDLGSTHIKAGAFSQAGECLRTALQPAKVETSSDLGPVYQPEQFWKHTAAVIGEVTSSISQPVAALGIASMAETGLLINVDTGEPQSPIIPWFNTNARERARHVRDHSSPVEVFLKTGLRVNYKSVLAKVLWLKEKGMGFGAGVKWLSIAGYIVYRLTGEAGTDHSLAGRTAVFNIHQRSWDEGWLRSWGVPPELFPRSVPSGYILGHTGSAGKDLGLPDKTPVAVSGHDHLCAGAAVAAIVQGNPVFDSMGTAETLIGTLSDRTLSKEDYQSGLLFGCHTVPNRKYWMGNASMSGGAIEWVRALLGEERMSYQDLNQLLDRGPEEPTGILFFPYLIGKGAPHERPGDRGGWVGLLRQHDRAWMAKSVLEGVAYEMERVRRAGEMIAESPVRRLIAAGGGIRNTTWMQIKADVSGCIIDISPITEAALAGAAFLVGSTNQMIDAYEWERDFPHQGDMSRFSPESESHAVYQALFENGYLELGTALEKFSQLEVLESLSIQ